MINKYEIIKNVWNSGDKKNRSRIEDERLLIENFAYKCLEAYDKKLNEKPKKSIAENLFGGNEELKKNNKDIFKF